jgi:hypothetical protein
VIYVGIDWAEAHQDVCAVDEAGEIVMRMRIADCLGGVAQLDAALAERAASATEVVIGIETDRGLLVQALVAAGVEQAAAEPCLPFFIEWGKETPFPGQAPVSHRTRFSHGSN